MNDRASWLAGPTDFISRWLPLMRAVHAETPERLEAWVLRLVDAGHRAIPLLSVAS
jgi:hypothetical protein